MWRILGLLFYSNKEYFLETKKAFSEEKAKAFCREKGIGIGDTAVEIIRLKNNASDNFLQVIKPINPEEVLSQIPECKAIVVTGQKAMDTILSVLLSDRRAESRNLFDIHLTGPGDSDYIVCLPHHGPIRNH